MHGSLVLSRAGKLSVFLLTLHALFHSPGKIVHRGPSLPWPLSFGLGPRIFGENAHTPNVKY